jgi:hypothetical protein
MVFFVFAFLISFRFYVVRCTLQCIISKELNGDHPLVYEEALTNEYNIHKKLEVNQFLSLSFVYGFLCCTFCFFAFISLVLLVAYLGTSFALLSFVAI